MALYRRYLKRKCPSYSDDEEEEECVIQKLKDMAQSPPVIEGARENSSSPCLKHRDQSGAYQMHLYVCWDESKFICHQCWIEEHQGHKCYDINFLVDYYRRTLRDSIALVKKKIREVKECQAPHEEFRLSFSAGYKLVEEKITYMDKGWERNKTNPYMDCKDIFNNKLKALDYIDLRFKRELMEFELLIIQIENLLKKEDNKMATETNEWKELIDKAKKIQLSDDLITLPREKHNASDFYPIYNTFTKKVELTTLRKVVLEAHASQQDLAFEFLLFLYKIRELTLIRYNVSCRFLHKEDENWNILITTRTSISVLQIERRRSNNDILPRNSLLFKCVGDTVEMTKHEDIHDNVYYDIHLRGQPGVPTFAAKITDAFEVLLVKIFETTELSANRDVVLRKKWYER